MMLPTNQKGFSFQQSSIIIIAFITFLHFTSCECDGVIKPSSNKPEEVTPPQPPAPQLSITSLAYDSVTNLITCIIQNQDKQFRSGKLILQITPGQDTDAAIQEVAGKDGKYEIEFNEAIPAAGSPLTKDFTVEWHTKLTSEFTFQVIYATEKVALPIGSPVLVSCHRSVFLLKDLAYNQNSGDVTCTIENQGKEDIADIVVHWETETPGVQITKSTSIVQEMTVGPVREETSQSIDSLGQLDFGKNASALFTFWLTRGSDDTRYSEQPVNFQLPVLPVSLQLVAIGPTSLETEANKVFKIKIQQGTDSNTVYPALTQLHIKKNSADSTAKILYSAIEATSLLGSELGDVWEEIALEVDPGTERTVVFSVQLTYGGQDKGELKFYWYKEVGQAAFEAAFEAVKEKNLEALKKFLDSPDNLKKINASDPQTGHTLLTQTIESLGDQGWEFVNVLLDKGAQVNSLDNTGFNPLHTAITHILDDHAQITNRFLAADSINIGITTDTGNTPLHLAAYYGREATMKQLLNKLSTNIKDKTTILNQKNSGGKTALQLAVENKHDNIAQQLLLAGADKSINTDQMSEEMKNKLTELSTKS